MKRTANRAISVLLTLVMVFGAFTVLPVTARADSLAVTEYLTSWTDGNNYIVSGEVTVSERITVNGAVTLTLSEGAILNANDAIIVPVGSTLTIEGTGTLNASTASSVSMAACIGGEGKTGFNGTNCDAGTIIINGGTVNALNTNYGAGIGGAPTMHAGTVIINGGTVNASSKGSCAAIGGGSSCTGGSVTINGGSVTAVNTSDGAAIGSGDSGAAIAVTITGGSVTATGNQTSAAIGGGSRSSGNVTINGGTVQATTGRDMVGLAEGAAIGGGSGAGGTVAILGGKVTAVGVGKAMGIGGGEESEGATITLGWTNLNDFIDCTSYNGTVSFVEGQFFTFSGTWETVTAQNLRPGKIWAANGPGKHTVSVESAENGTVTADKAEVYPDETVTLTAASAYSYSLTGLTAFTASGAVELTRIDVNTYTFVMPEEDVVVTPVFSRYIFMISVESAENGTVTADKTEAPPDETVTLTVACAYPYSLTGLTAASASGAVPLTRTGYDTYTFVMPEEDVVVTPVFTGYVTVPVTTSEGERDALKILPSTPSLNASDAEWYAVTEDLVFSGRLPVEGNVKLYLCAGATLTCERGIQVTAGNALTIEGEGTLIANAGLNDQGYSYDAAIGSDSSHVCGSITIRSGTVTATGSNHGAAIGAGLWRNGGAIAILGGKVTAIGGERGPGIGGSYSGDDGGTITLGWTEADDFIECSAYNGAVSFVEGKEFLRANDYLVATADNIGGVRIIPKLTETHGISVSYSGDGTFSANTDSAVANATVTLCWSGASRYIVPSTISVRDSEDNEISVEWTSPGTATFTMPDSDVTVSAMLADAGYVTVTTSEGSVDCRPITQHLSFDDYSGGWYAVTEDTTISARVFLSGDVKLCLCAGATLTCAGGITVNEGNSLTIEGEGSLVADARSCYGGTGIGGYYPNWNAPTGTITIRGGSVTAYGGELAAGIGGGIYGSSGTVTIDGGTVTAYGGDDGAGIGGGFACTVGAVAIHGGNVSAYGGDNAHGIGRGWSGKEGSVILGWTAATDSIFATSYRADSVAFQAGQFFVLQGSGETATSGNIGGQTIVPYLGETYAISETANACCSVDAIYADGQDSTVKATDAPAGSTVYVRCSLLDEYYYERELTGLTVTWSGGDVEVAALGDGAFRFVMPAGAVTIEPLTPLIVYYDLNLVLTDGNGYFNYIKREFNDSEYTFFAYLNSETEKHFNVRPGDTVYLRTNEAAPYYTSGVTLTTVHGESVPVTQHNDKKYSFVMPADGVVGTVQAAELETVVRNTSEGEQTCLALRRGVTEWTDYAAATGVYWFTATEDTTLDFEAMIHSNVSVHLYLTAGTTLICPGIYVEEGSSLTIEGEGTLLSDSTGETPIEDADGFIYGYAGIGGGGNITIKSGNITAKGRFQAAGIGGQGGHSGTGTGGYSGDITITGGTVTAYGGNYGAGIGSGFRQNCGVVTITGGTVNAYGGLGAAGIGGGYAANGDIRISGGVINATGGSEGAGIGGGSTGTGGKISITGGIVTALGNGGGQAYGYGAGIGEGSYAGEGAPSVISITGGQVTARGGFDYGNMINGVFEEFYSAGIGLGWQSRIGECDITLGWTEQSDFIDCDRYYGVVQFADNKYFTLSGTDTFATPDNIDGRRIVPYVIIEYPLHLGETVVTSYNHLDILGDGRASFDPTTNTLTLNDPEITGVYEDPDNWICRGKIVSDGLDLTVKGSYHMTSAETLFGLMATDGSVTLDGDFTFMGTSYGLGADVNHNVTLLSGSLKAVGTTGSVSYGLTCAGLTIGADAERLEAQGDAYALYLAAGSAPTIPETMYIRTPENGVIKNKTLYEADGTTVAKTVVIERKPSLSALADGYYLIGPDWTVDAIDPAELFTENPNSAGEYMLETALAAGDQIKVVKVENGAIAATNGWYPDGLNNQYTVDADHAGLVTIYFQTTYKDDWSSFGGYIWIERSAAPQVTHSLSLKDEIDVNFYMALPESCTAANTTVTFAWGDGKTAAGTLAEATGNAAAQGYTRVVQCPVPARSMTDTITMTVKQGDTVLLTDTYSIAGYCADAAEYFYNDDLLLNTLCDMLDYGGLVQREFDYQKDDLADAHIQNLILAVNAKRNTAYSWTRAALPATPIADPDTNVETVDFTGYGIQFYAASLTATAKTAIRLYFTVTDAAAFANTKVYLGETALDFVEKNGRYYVEISEINAKNIFDTVELTFRNGTNSMTVKYNSIHYLNAVQDSTNAKFDNLKLVMNAMYNYWNSARLYFQSTNS